MKRDRFDTLMIEYLPNLSLLAHHYEANNDKANDLLQETLLQMYEMCDAYYDRNFFGWGHTILYNIYRNHLRKFVGYAIEAENHAPIDIDESYVAQYDITTAIDKLSAKHRLAIEQYFAGYHYTEIAMQLGIETGTVKSRISRARKQLQAMLAAYQYTS